MATIKVTEENFKTEVADSALPVLVDFWADWCGPCKMIAPILEEVSNDLAGKLKVAKVNVDDCQGLAGKFNIMSIPTMIIFKNGEAVQQIVGAMSKDQLLGKIKPNL